MAERPLWIPDHARQIRFHEQLVFARRIWLMDALSNTLRQVNSTPLNEQLIVYVPDDVQRLLAAAGVRDEHVFPLPVVAEVGVGVSVSGD